MPVDGRVTEITETNSKVVAKLDGKTKHFFLKTLPLIQEIVHISTTCSPSQFEQATATVSGTVYTEKFDVEVNFKRAIHHWFRHNF